MRSFRFFFLVVLAWGMGILPATAELEMGGFLQDEQRYYRFNNSSPVNPDNQLNIPKYPNTVKANLFITTGVTERSKIRVEASYIYESSSIPTVADVILGRVKNQPQASQPGLGRLEIDRAYIDLALTDNFYIRAGKQRIAWGPALFWNPTDSFNPPKDPLFDPIGDRFGINALRLDFTVESVDLTSVFIPNFARKMDFIDFAQKIKFHLGPADVAFSVQGGNHRRWQPGLDFSVSLFDATFYGEGIYQSGSDIFGPGDFYSWDVGMIYAFPFGLRVALEALHQGEGFDTYDNYLRYLATHPEAVNFFPAGRVLADYAVISSQYALNNLFTLRLDAVFGYADFSYAIRPSLDIHFTDDTVLTLGLTQLGGNDFSEFLSAPVRTIATATARLSF